MIAETEAPKTKAAPPSKDNAALAGDLIRDDCNRSTKWRTTLTNLLRGPRHRFDAEKWGDHALHSTVSTLTRNHGIEIAREWREVPTRFGKPCRVRAYWVDELSRAHAMRLVAKRKRDAQGNTK
jgi:hypothetical protein